MGRWLAIFMLFAVAGSGNAVERQLTSTPKNHDLDNNDNFSGNGAWLCYDTRETAGPGIDNCTTIEAVEVATGAERLLYRPAQVVTGSRPAPGVGAVSFCPVEDKVIFIHGPHVEELGARGPYAKPNRQGAIVPLDGSGVVTWADCRDVDTTRDTLPGAHRGGTHRHEYCADGSRIGFTYDDFLLTQYDRTIGCMVPSAQAPGGATHYFMVLVPVVPKDTAKPGEIEKAWGDSWVGADGAKRAFIGKVRNDDGVTYEQSLYIAELPKEIDLASSDSGGPQRFPQPPKGVVIRRITHAWADGIVRGAPDGSRIAYYAKDAHGQTQIFVVDADGSDEAAEEEKRPVQITRFDGGVTGFMRWHPSGKTILCITAKNGIAAVRTAPGEGHDQVRMLAPEDLAPERSRLVVSPDGKVIAFNKPVPMADDEGRPLRTYDGKDFLQVFTMPFPDDNGDGIAD
jgi:hypothetical protein